MGVSMSLADLVNPPRPVKPLQASRRHEIADDPELTASARMKALNADPEFKAKTSARMKALHADPEFNPLAGLRAEQRKVYRKLRNCGVPKQVAIAEAART